MWSLYKEPFNDLNCGAIVLLKDEHLDAMEKKYDLPMWRGGFRITGVTIHGDTDKHEYAGIPVDWNTGKKADGPFCDMLYEFEPKDVKKKK